MPIPPDQLSELVDEHWATLVAWVSMGGGNQRAMSEDVVQEAFLRLSVQDELPERPVAWLMTVARRLAMNHRLSENRRNAREHASSEMKPRQTNRDGSRSPMFASAEIDEVRSMLERLDEQERRVLIAKLWADLSWEEIAESLECSRATVWRTYRRAIENLKSIYSEH